MPSGWSTSSYRSRVYAAAGTAYVTQRTGYITYDVTNRLAPALLNNANSSGQFGWKQIVLNGSGLGVCAVGNNSGPDGGIALYKTSDPLINNDFVASFVTPGVARAVTLYNGLAYIASYYEGLTVLNYLPYDTQRQPPSLSYRASNLGGKVESNGQVFVEVDARDDVQVRNVTLLVDGNAVARDGSYPFQFYFNAPSITLQPTVTINVVATDTGGNSTNGLPQTFTIVPDITPPRVSSSSPGDLGVTSEVTQIALYFSEALDTSALSTDAFALINLGADGAVGGGDDMTVPVSGIDKSDTQRLLLLLAAPLPEGTYQLEVSPMAITDLSGNPMASPYIKTLQRLVRHLRELPTIGVASETETGLMQGIGAQARCQWPLTVFGYICLLQHPP
jgi:hypothetical protein